MTNDPTTQRGTTDMTNPPTPLIGDKDYTTGALMATTLASLAGDEAAIIDHLQGMANRFGIATVRRELALCALVTYGHLITPHEVGAPVPITIPGTEPQA